MDKRLNVLWRKLSGLMTGPNERGVVWRSDVGQSQSFPPLTMLGQFEESAPSFVRHVALMIDQSTLPGTIAVFHMGPPLVSTRDALTFDPEELELEPDLAADLSLSEEQETLIGRWIAGISNQKGPLDKRRYAICPHMIQKRNERGIVQFTQFSCAGFVLEAYRAAKIDLCNTDSLPPVHLDLLRPVYDDLDDILGRRTLRRHYGISGDPPWPVLMPAYLFHGVDHRNLGREEPFSLEFDSAQRMSHFPALE